MFKILSRGFVLLCFLKSSSYGGLIFRGWIKSKPNFRLWILSLHSLLEPFVQTGVFIIVSMIKDKYEEMKDKKKVS